MNGGGGGAKCHFAMKMKKLLNNTIVSKVAKYKSWVIFRPNFICHMWDYVCEMDIYNSFVNVSTKAMV